MSSERRAESMPGLNEALAELKQVIRAKYPEATFVVAPTPDDDEAIDLIITVDIPDTDDIVDLVIDHVLEIQVDRRLPIHVVPVRPLDRVIAEAASAKRCW